MMASERRFPIQGGPSIPWRLVEPYEAQAQRNHSQTLEELARRGGLSPSELMCLMQNRDLFPHPPDAEGLAFLRKVLAEDDFKRGRESLEHEWEARDEKSWDDGYKEGRLAGLREAAQLVAAQDVSLDMRLAAMSGAYASRLILRRAEEVERT